MKQGKHSGKIGVSEKGKEGSRRVNIREELNKNQTFSISKLGEAPWPVGHL